MRKKFISTLAALRREKGLTQIELAQRVGISQPEISYIESGYINPRRYLLERLAQVLDIQDPDTLKTPYNEYIRKENLQSESQRHNPFQSGIPPDTDSLSGGKSYDYPQRIRRRPGSRPGGRRTF